MEFVRVWKNGAYSIQKFTPDRILWDAEKKRYRFKMSANHVNPIQKKDRKPSTFPITRKSRLTFLARSLNLFDRCENEVSTQVMSFRTQPDDPYTVLNRYLTNLKRHYGLKEYVSALEVTKKGIFHFHLLVDMPFVEVKKLNKAFVKARGDYSKNGLTGVKKVDSVGGVIYYNAKYNSKNQSKAHSYKKFTYSRGVMGSESQIFDSNAFFKSFKSISESEHDYCYTGMVSFNQELKNMFDDEKMYYECEKLAKMM